jgi:ketosteroid isomerase-like protein
MSQENIDLILRGYEAWNRGDLDWILDHLTDDFEFHPAPDFFDLDPVYHGHDGFRKFWRIWRGAWETVMIRVQRTEDLGDRAYVLVRFEGIGRGSGASVSMSFGQIWRLRDGLAARLDVLDPQDALETAGLTE